MADRNSFPAKYGPWALVAGGSDGLGAAFASELARRGLNLLLVARNADRLQATSAEIAREFHVETRALPLDVAKSEDLDEIIDRARDLDVGLLVCNAASAPIGEFLDLPPEAHEQVIDTNCRAAALLVRGMGARMAKRGRGGIILVSSLAGFQGAELVAHYAASKAYLRVLAEGLWKEFRRLGVDVLACCAGITDTPAYRRSSPRISGWSAVAPMDPHAVAVQALASLGKRPVMVPGWKNRLAGLIMQRVVPKKLAVSLVSANTRAMYSKKA